MKRLLFLASLACCSALSCFAKTIAAGETETITEDLTLNENLIVKGTLNIIGAKVTLATGKYLYVGTENNQTYANLNVKDGEIAMPSTSWDSLVLIGKDGGYGRVTLDNSTLTAGRMQLSYNTEWARAQLIVTNNSTVALNAGYLELNAKANGRTAGTTIQSQVWLYEGCRLSAVGLQGRDDRTGGVYFGGGTLAVRCVTAAENAALFLRGINGHPIRLQYVIDSNDPVTSLFTIQSSTANIYLGARRADELATPFDCGFTKLGPLDVPLVTAGREAQLHMAYTGGTRIEAGGMELTADNQLPVGGDVHVGASAALRLAGHSQSWGSFTGGGLVSNATDTPVQITLTVPEERIKTLSAPLPSGPVSIVKTGAGALVAERNTFAGVTVQEGAVRFADPVANGYPEYEFIVDRPYGTGYTGMTFAELDFYSGDENVTTPLDGREGGNAELFDHDPKTACWWDCNYSSNPIGSRGYVIAKYAAPKKITSFTWTTHSDTPPTADWCYDPGAWRLRGRYHGGEWVTLQQMANEGYSLNARSTETEKFPVVYPQTAVSLGGATFSGGSLSLDGEVAVKVPASETFTATGSEVILSALSVDMTEGAGTIVGGALATNGKLYLTGVPDGRISSGATISLTFNGTTCAEGARWQLYVDGVLQERRTVLFENGRFKVCGTGLVLVFR